MKKQLVLFTISFLSLSTLSAQHSNTKSTESIKIPLTISDREICVKAKVDGKEGEFYWDTGAPMVVVNTDLEMFNPKKGESSNHSMGGSTGSINSITRHQLSRFEISGIVSENMASLGMPLGHLKENNFGMIGVQFMKGYLTEFDLKSQTIRMNQLDNNGEVTDPAMLTGYQEMETSWHAHLPVVKVKVSGLELNMLLDSGCSSMMIDPKYNDKLTGSYTFIEKDTLRGAGKDEKPIDALSFKKVELAGHTFTNVRGIFEGVQGHGMENIDGIIGWDVFWACKLAYNVDRSAVYIKSN